MLTKASEIVAAYAELGKKAPAEKSELQQYGLYADVKMQNNLYGVIIALLLTIYLVFNLPSEIDTVMTVVYYCYTALMIVMSALCVIGGYTIHKGTVEKFEHLTTLGKMMMRLTGRLSATIGLFIELYVIALCFSTQAYVLGSAVLAMTIAVCFTRSAGIKLSNVLLGAARSGETKFEQVTELWLKARRETV